MKKVLSIVLSIAMVVCLMPSMAFASADASGTGEVDGRQTFTDIDGLKCEGAVNVLNALGVVNGFPDGTFRPGEDVTRAHMAQMITKALDIETYANATTSIFSDMDSATWAIPQVEYCAQLGIVKGYGDGTFGPNDLVTYEQAATMLTRAIGYTDDCNEMIAGVWPANYVQKALDLGIFADTNNGGTKTANRGDVALMLYNALNLPQVYIDNEGVTQFRSGSEEFAGPGGVFLGTSMLYTLNKDGFYEYGVVGFDEIDDAIYDISEYFGIVAKIYRDKDDNVLALGDIQTTLLTGTFNGDFDKFNVDGKEYTFGATPVREVTGGRNARFDTLPANASEAEVFNNGTQLANGLENADNNKGLDGLKNGGQFDFRQDEKVTISAKTSGSSINQVFAVYHWSKEDNYWKTAVVEESDIATINNKQTLLGYDFIKDDEGNPDTKTFVLLGVDELSDIAEDDVVTVYANESKKIRRVEVGTEQVDGNLDSFSTGSAADAATKWGKPATAVIDGTSYKTSYLTIAEDNNDSDMYLWCNDDSEDVSVGDVVEAWLDYEGAIYQVKQSEAGTSSYAMVLDYYVRYSDEDSRDEIINGSGLNGNNSMVSLLAANGNIYTFYFKDKADVVYDGDSIYGVGLEVGDIVTYDLNSANRIRKIKIKGDSWLDLAEYDTTVSGETSKIKQGLLDMHDVTNKGYWGDYALSETATVFSIDRVTFRDVENDDVAEGLIPLYYVDDDDCGVTNYERIKGTDDVINIAKYIKNNKIASMVVNGDAVSSSKTFGYISSWTSLSSDDPSGCNYRITALIDGESNTYYADIDEFYYNIRKILVQFKFNASGYVNEIRVPYNSDYEDIGGSIAEISLDDSKDDLRLLGYAIAGHSIELDNGDVYNEEGNGIKFKNGATAAYLEYQFLDVLGFDWDDFDAREDLISVESDARYYEWKGGSGSIANSTKGDIESADDGKYILYFSAANDDDDASGVANVVLMLDKNAATAELNGVHVIDFDAVASAITQADENENTAVNSGAEDAEASIAVA